MSKIDDLEDLGCDELIIFGNGEYDDAIIGVTTDNRVVYDFDLMVECLVKRDNCDEIEAVEWIEYNTIRSLTYVEGAPVIMYPLR